MAGLSINSRDQKKIRSLLKNIPSRYKAVASDVIREEYSKAVTQARALASRQSYDGDLVAGIKLIEKVKTFEFVSQAPHAPYVEFGTKTHVTIPIGFERMAAKFVGGTYRIRREGGSFSSRIKEWAKRRGIKSNSQRGGGSGKGYRSGWQGVMQKIIAEGMGENNTPHFVPSIIAARRRLKKRLTEILEKSLGR